MELDTAAEIRQCFDSQRAARRISGIMARELRGQGTGTGRITRRFLGSVTHKGPVWRFDSAETLCSKIYELEDSYEQAGGLLSALCAEAVRRSYDVIACPSPEEPERLEHLLIPELGVAFVTSKPGMEYPGKPYRRVRLNALSHPESKARLRFRSRMAGVLREGGLPPYKMPRRRMTGWRVCITPMWILRGSGAGGDRGGAAAELAELRRRRNGKDCPPQSLVL